MRPENVKRSLVSIMAVPLYLVRVLQSLKPLALITWLETTQAGRMEKHPSTQRPVTLFVGMLLVAPTRTGLAVLTLCSGQRQHSLYIWVTTAPMVQY